MKKLLAPLFLVFSSPTLGHTRRCHLQLSQGETMLIFGSKLHLIRPYHRWLLTAMGKAGIEVNLGRTPHGWPYLQLSREAECLCNRFYKRPTIVRI